jgi:S-adenosylmethionine/arginine decarboxylase-like enzyme
MPNLHRHHRHLILNCVVGRTPTSVSACRDWLNALVPKINMNILTPATCVRCDDPGNEGITGTVVISTSHAAFHYWLPESDCPNRLSFCLYSCAPFDPEVVIEHVHQFWWIKESRHKLIDRDWEIVEAAPWATATLPG